jgi:hypothetical protein
MSLKSHRPDLLTPLVDLAVWIQSDFGEAERRSIACGIASGVHDVEAQSIAFWHAWLAHEVPFLQHDRHGDALGSSIPSPHSQPVRSDEFVVALSSSRSPPSDSTISTAEDSDM